MKKNNFNLLIRIIILVTLSLNLSSAVKCTQFNTESPTEIIPSYIQDNDKLFGIEAYSEMSTEFLEERVQELSRKGQLPFEMGQELIQRWSQN